MPVFGDAERILFKPQSVYLKSPQGYAGAIGAVTVNLRNTKNSAANDLREWERSRNLWIDAMTAGMDSAGKKVRTDWAPAQIPEPSIGFAAWIFSLYRKKFGIIGASYCTGADIMLAIRNGASVGAETAKGICFVDFRASSASELVLSDKTRVMCNEAGCDQANVRQWIVFFPDTKKLCEYLALLNMAAGRGKGFEYYPQMLVDYLQLTGGDSAKIFPEGLVVPSCFMRRKEK
jgi:hypothetical protein